jgi:hypothetical protein
MCTACDGWRDVKLAALQPAVGFVVCLGVSESSLAAWPVAGREPALLYGSWLIRRNCCNGLACRKIEPLQKSNFGDADVGCG